jgi:hypothetical protein
MKYPDPDPGSLKIYRSGSVKLHKAQTGINIFMTFPGSWIPDPTTPKKLVVLTFFAAINFTKF